MTLEEKDAYFTKLLGPDKGKGQGYRPGWVSCDISRTTGGHMLTFRYRGASVDYKRAFSLTEMQGKEVLPVLFPAAFKRLDVEHVLADQCQKLEAELTDARAVADASVRYSSRALEERDRARQELAGDKATPHPANRLYEAIVKAVEEFFPAEARDLEWDVLPGSLRKKLLEVNGGQDKLKEAWWCGWHADHQQAAHHQQAADLLTMSQGAIPKALMKPQIQCSDCGDMKSWQGKPCKTCAPKPPKALLGHQRDDGSDSRVPQTPIERLRDWFAFNDGEERPACLREVMAMAEELVEARKALGGQEMGVEAGRLPELIMVLKAQIQAASAHDLCQDDKAAEIQALQDRIKAVRKAMGQPDDEGTAEDEWYRIYEAKHQMAHQMARATITRRTAHRDSALKELRDVKKMCRSWIKMNAQFTHTNLYKWALQEDAQAHAETKEELEPMDHGTCGVVAPGEQPEVKKSPCGND